MPKHDPAAGAGGSSRTSRPAPSDREHYPGADLKALLHKARDLKSARGRREQGRFLIEGIRLLEDALDQEVPIVQIFMTPHLLEATPRGEYLARWLRSSGIPLAEIGERYLTLVADTDTPAGVVAVADLPTPPAELPLPGEDGLEVVLFDQVRDPGNAGGIIRTAAAAGVSHVVSLEQSVDLWAPKVVRAGAGAHFRVHLHGGQPAPEVEAWLARWPQVVVADGGARTSIYELDWRRPSVLVLGNEARGLSGWLDRLPLVRARIPMRAEVESLNVAAAAAVFLYEGRRHLLREH